MKKLVAIVSLAIFVASLATPALAQKGDKFNNPYFPEQNVLSPTVTPGPILLRTGHPLPQVDQSRSTNWVLHNGDLSNSRYSGLDLINKGNINSLAVKWRYQTGVAGNNQSTPIVVDGVMYGTDTRANVYALDAATGDLIWSYKVDSFFGAGEGGITNRGVVYGDGVIYVAGGPDLFALDAKTGQPMADFGVDGRASVVTEAIKDRFPGVELPIEYGYAFTMAPQYYDGKVYVGTTLSEYFLPGGLMLAVDAKTGALLWAFNTIPQDESDPNWEIAGPTWVGGHRNGGGIWETASIDPDTNTIFVAVSNATPDLDGSKRHGINLFTDSIVALDANSGRLRWYFQQVHHDLWDYDSASHPVLFTATINGQQVKALGEGSKCGLVFLLNRETGSPLHGFYEMPVSTVTDVPGEQPWPTQPIPLKANGQPMEAVVPVVPTNGVTDELAGIVTQPYTPPSVKGSLHAPGITGGVNFAPLAYSPESNLIYAVGLDIPSLFTVDPTLEYGPGPSFGFSIGGAAGRADYRPTPRSVVKAYDVATGEAVWQAQVNGACQAGPVLTAGGLLFVPGGDGVFHALDALSGQELWSYNTGTPNVKGSPMVYQVDGKEYIGVTTLDGSFFTFGLPE